MMWVKTDPPTHGHEDLRTRGRADRRSRGIELFGIRIPELQRMNPGYVVIGDSMAGTRINERLLTELTGQPVAPLLQAGTGPVFWYLALKNWVIASGVKPRAVFIFFRDTNLTDTMFRLDEQFRWSLDMVAAEREDELNGVVASVLEGPFYAVHDAVERVYAGDRARRAIEPALTRAPATWITSSRRRQVELLAHANERFGLEHRDYVYIPLGGSQAGELKWARNVLVTFLLSGLWHGASWNYVLWGGYHGVLLILTRAHRILEPAKSPEGAGASGSAIRRLVVPLQIAGMFVLTLFGWLLFRQTELAAIARDLQLSPFAASPEDQRTGCIYSCSRSFIRFRCGSTAYEWNGIAIPQESGNTLQFCLAAGRAWPFKVWPAAPRLPRS